MHTCLADEIKACKETKPPSNVALKFCIVEGRTKCLTKYDVKLIVMCESCIRDCFYLYQVGPCFVKCYEKHF
jgi:hypothetical protein